MHAAEGLTHQNGRLKVIAPAGSFESLQAALDAGSDAVYFGIEQLNMRARSSINFTLRDLKEIVHRCRKYGVKSYITLNTIIYDHDIRLAYHIIDEAKRQGVDAIIACDPAIMLYASEQGVSVHLSTQANVSNLEAVRFYSQWTDVIVLARELSLMQIQYITREIRRKKIKGPSGNPVGIEVFAHGAMCVAISGKCYMSLATHNASANRGACIQNCRKSYTVTDDEGNQLRIENEYIMSPKDLMTIDILDQIARAGVQYIKIEGRGRAADYVHTVVKCYREAVDSLYDGTYSAEKIYRWKEKLQSVYNRGFWEGYYLGKKRDDWQSGVYGSKATRKKIFLGRGVKYFPKIQVAEFAIETHSLKVGDRILITGPTTGVIESEVEEIRVGEKPVKEARKGEHFSIKIPRKIRPSDKLYKLVDA